MKEIHFRLTQEQIEVLRPLWRKVTWASANGKPGMCLAQLYEDGTAAAGFVNQKKANAVQSVLVALGSKTPLGAMSSSVRDRTYTLRKMKARQRTGNSK